MVLSSMILMEGGGGKLRLPEMFSTGTESRTEIVFVEKCVDDGIHLTIGPNLTVEWTLLVIGYLGRGVG